MSRTWAVIKREFLASVRTRTFILGTLFGPLLMIGIFVVPSLLAGRGKRESKVAIVDLTGVGIGQQSAEALRALSPPSGAGRVEQDSTRESRGEITYLPQVIEPNGRSADQLRSELDARIAADSLDAYIWIPADAAQTDTVQYIAHNVTNFGELSQIRSAVQSAVQQRRLSQQGMDPVAVAGAMRPVRFAARKAGETGAGGVPEVAFIIAYMLGFAVYLIVILYGNGVMRGVLEEKRDRVVELVVSSIRSEQLMVGKVLGIGAAGLTQVLVWVLFAAAVIGYGEGIAASIGVDLPGMPAIPASVGLLFVVFFAGGFLIYSSLYAMMGAIATTDQEAQQMQFPVMLPLFIAILMQQAVLQEPDGAVAIWGSIIPFTSPVVVPARAYLTHIPAMQIAAGLLLEMVGVVALLWAAAKIYRIGILSTGKRPSLAELLRWLRAA